MLKVELALGHRRRLHHHPENMMLDRICRTDLEPSVVQSFDMLGIRHCRDSRTNLRSKIRTSNRGTDKVQFIICSEASSCCFKMTTVDLPPHDVSPCQMPMCCLGKLGCHSGIIEPNEAGQCGNSPRNHLCCYREIMAVAAKKPTFVTPVGECHLEGYHPSASTPTRVCHYAQNSLASLLYRQESSRKQILSGKLE